MSSSLLIYCAHAYELRIKVGEAKPKKTYTLNCGFKFRLGIMITSYVGYKLRDLSDISKLKYLPLRYVVGVGLPVKYSPANSSQMIILRDDNAIFIGTSRAERQ